MNGGYVMIDCKGLDLTSNEEQTINGLYDDMVSAIKSGRPLVAYNCVWGLNNNSPMTPIPFFAQNWSDSTVMATASSLNITCTSADKVTVTSLV